MCFKRALDCILELMKDISCARSSKSRCLQEGDLQPHKHMQAHKNTHTLTNTVHPRTVQKQSMPFDPAMPLAPLSKSKGSRT